MSAPQGQAWTAAEARRHAQTILHERRFRGSSVPRPFHRMLVWISDRFSPVGHLFDRLARHVPGGGWTLGAVLGGLVVVVSVLASARVAHRRAALRVEGGERARQPDSADPAALEREADAAEAGGDAGTALRLRFRAGLLRLGRARVVPQRDSLTSGEARRILRLPVFDQLARTHDEVVYGGRPARSADAVEARERWPEVLGARGVRR